MMPHSLDVKAVASASGFNARMLNRNQRHVLDVCGTFGPAIHFLTSLVAALGSSPWILEAQASSKKANSIQLHRPELGRRKTGVLGWDGMWHLYNHSNQGRSQETTGIIKNSST